MPVCLLYVEAGTIGYRVHSDVICNLMRIGGWAEHRFVFVCLLVEVIREADANDNNNNNIYLKSNIQCT